jgi:hypothetical protein
MPSAYKINELEALVKEFKIYPEKNKLWTNDVREINYHIADDEIGRFSIVDGVVFIPFSIILLIQWVSSFGNYYPYLKQ